MYREIDPDTWKRKNQYEHFKDFDDPFFNITGCIDVTPLYHFCKKENLSFFLANLFYSLQTTNEIEAFRTRILDDKIVVYDTIHAGSTILHDDETFSFCYFENSGSVFEFVNSGRKRIEEQLSKKVFDPKLNDLNMTHYSVIPWIKFTAFKHAKKFGSKDSIPKIVFGKLSEENQKKEIPVSIEVNHCLVDGFHVGQYFQIYQQKINEIARF